MGFWSQLFGGPARLPDRDRGPSAPEPGEMRDGLKQGVWVERDPDRSWCLLESIYRDGVRQGPFREWNPELGEVRGRGTFVDGKEHGECEVVIAGGVVRVRHEMRAGVMHGAFRALHPDGSLDYEREYRDGKIWSGPEVRDLIDGTVVWRARYADGALDGDVEENDVKGRPVLRARYAGGVLDGPYVQHWPGGGIKQLAGSYRAGARIGRWTCTRGDDSICAAIDHDAAAPVWRWIGRDGAPGPELDARDDADLWRWVPLVEAWFAFEAGTGHWISVEPLVRAWPADDRRRAHAWLDARTAAPGPQPIRTVVDVERMRHDPGDPGDGWATGLSLDHHELSADDVAALLGRAATLRELSLCECEIAGGVGAVFPDGVAWPVLEHLLISECNEDGADDGAYVGRIAAATWTGQLRALTLDGVWSQHAAALVRSPHLGGLRQLRLRTAFSAELAAALASSPVLDHLELLELRVADGAPVVAAIARRSTPALRYLELQLDLDDLEDDGVDVDDLDDDELEDRLAGVAGVAGIASEDLFALVDPARRPALVELQIDLGYVDVPEALAAALAARRPGVRAVLR
jgi:hypothetical protein